MVRESLASLVYGPSYISLEYALGFYGLIPERVESITCITTKRNKEFQTPIGTFAYRTIPAAAYPVGIRQIYWDATHPVLMASLEKAILDKFWITRRSGIRNAKDFKDFLYQDQRFDENVLRTVRPRVLMACAKLYGRVRMLTWASWLREELR